MENLEIRRALNKNNIKHWEIAASLGVSEFTFSRWLRKELHGDKKAVIMHAIDNLAIDKASEIQENFAERFK